MDRITTRSLRLLILVVVLMTSHVKANFFSRILSFGSGEDDSKKQHPSGAAASLGSEAQVGSVITYEDGVLFASLASGNKIPLIGVGVGNSPPGFVSSLIAEGVQPDKSIRLVDTAHASHNENLVATGLIAGVEKMGRRVEVHVVTKVWYTHLGYERTKLSIEESLKALEPALDNELVDLKLHLLLHWPRCYANVEWMKCDEEEANLPDHVKQAGPSPNLNPERAWKDSWRFLEDLYLSDKYPIASIGVSNFHLQDLENLEAVARIHPHVLQTNLWSLLYDSKLVDYCHKHRIHVQVYNAMHGTVVKPETAPRAFHHIQKIAFDISDATQNEVTPAQIILAWLIQHGVSVIPRTSKIQRLHENSARALAAVPALTDSQVEAVAHAVEAYLSGVDLEQDIHVSITFHIVSKDIMLYWLGHGGEEVRIAHVKKGETFSDTTYPNHIFRTYDASNKDIYTDHEIQANFGDHKDIHVEL